MKIQSGVFTVNWEVEGGIRKMEHYAPGTPDEIKRMIAQSLLNDLGIEIRI
jgi:hypothetical protein